MDKKRQLTMTTIFMGSGDTVSPEAGRHLGGPSIELRDILLPKPCSEFEVRAVLWEVACEPIEARMQLKQEKEIQTPHPQDIMPDHHGYT